MTPFPLHSRSTWLDEEKCQHSVIHKPHKSIPIYDEAIHDVYKPSKQTFPLLDLPSELLTQILIKLHPNKVKSLTRLSRAAHRRCRFTGFGAIWQHLYHYISAESSSLLPSSPSSPLSFLDSPFDLSEFQLLQSISWFHVNSNYMVALMMMKGGITPYTLSILIPEFESLNVLPPQPSRNLQPILRAFSEALERGLYLAVPECVPPVSIENATDSVPDKEEFREPGFPSAFVLFWLTTVDAIDVFADLVRRWGGDPSSFATTGQDLSGVPKPLISTSSHPRRASTASSPPPHLPIPILESALQSAASYGSVAIVHHLLDIGIDPRQDSNHAIQMSSENGHVAVVRLLLSYGCDPSADDSYALGMAAENGHEEVVRLLLEGGVRPDDDDDYALRLASANGHTEIVRMLMGTGRCDPGANDFYAMREAARLGYAEILEALVESGVSFE